MITINQPISRPKTEGSLFHRLMRAWTPSRIHGFEFCDQPWLKGSLREAFMDGLTFSFQFAGIYEQMYRPYSRWAKAIGTAEVLDLASGGGGPAETLVRSASANGFMLPKIILSNYYPQINSFKALKAEYLGQIDFIGTSVNAKNTVDHPARCVSVGTAFHHFEPDFAREVISNAVEKTDGFFMMDVFSREWHEIVLPLFSFFIYVISPFFAKRVTLKKILVTTIIPIVPMMIVWDGIVSALRSYRHDEIYALIPESAKQDWHWEFGYTSYMGIFRATYVYGYRKTDKRSSSVFGQGEYIYA
jgi:hypothetical protein